MAISFCLTKINTFVNGAYVDYSVPNLRRFVYGLADGWLVECGKGPIFFPVIYVIGDVGPPIGINNHEVRDHLSHMKNYRMEEESRDKILFLKMIL